MSELTAIYSLRRVFGGALYVISRIKRKFTRKNNVFTNKKTLAEAIQVREGFSLLSFILPDNAINYSDGIISAQTR